MKRNTELLIWALCMYRSIFYIVCYFGAQNSQRRVIKYAYYTSNCNWKGLYTCFEFVCSTGSVSFVWKGSHPGLLYLRPSPFDIYCFTTGTSMIFNYMNDFHSLKAARPSYAVFIDHKFEYVPHIFLWRFF